MRYWRAIKYALHIRSYLTFDKVLNYLKFRNDLRKRKVTPSSFPPNITFQTSTYCNSNCRLCPIGLHIERPKNGFLNFDTFRKVVDEAKHLLIRIDFADWGEPLLNQSIFEMIQYADENRIMAALATNLHSIKSEDDLKRIVDSGLSFITISLHGISQESYEAYQPGKDFEQTVNKIRSLVNLKRKLNKAKPIIDIVFAITKKNQHETGKMARFAKDLGVDSSIYTASLNLRFYMNDYDKLKGMTREWAQQEPLRRSDNTVFRKDRATELYRSLLEDKWSSFDELDRLKLTSRHFCLDPWRYLVVNWDGTVSLCCVDYGKYVMGNTHNESITEIWNNAKYHTVRKYLLGQRNDVLDFPCKRCIMY